MEERMKTKEWKKERQKRGNERMIEKLTKNNSPFFKFVRGRKF